MGQQYSDVWNGRTFEWVQVPVEGGDQQDGNLERALVPILPGQGEEGQLVVDGNGDELTGQEIGDSLVRRKFSVGYSKPKN